MIGRTVSHFTITAKLGAGGMGVVYRARDSRLQRDVAIKVLPEEFSKDADRTRRFQQEASAAGRLNHPNILTVYDVGVHEGMPYLVTELLEGETLRERVRRGPLAEREAADFTVQVSQGLAVAHEAGIVHRDLKPENLFITVDDRLKILDFGLAKVLWKGSAEDATTLTGMPIDLTTPGAILGTVGYMAPEQVRGLEVDHRADIFALGAILYEMLCGRRAFRGQSTADVLSLILREDPKLPEGAEISSSLIEIQSRCLKKDARDRFDSVRDLLLALEMAGEARESTSASAALSGDTSTRSVAVLLFQDLSGREENSHLGLGLTDAIITELSQTDTLVVRPTAAVLRYQKGKVEPLQAGRDLQVDLIMDGSFQRIGSQLRVTVQLIDVASGNSLWGRKIDASVDDIFQLQDVVSSQIAQALGLKMSREDVPSASSPRRTDSTAYEYYLKGKFHLYRETEDATRTAVEWFGKARRDDPSFTLAWTGLADAYSRLAFTFDPKGNWYGRAQEACDSALALDAELPEGRYVRARLLWSPDAGFRHADTMRELAVALKSRPNLNEAHEFLGRVLFHVGLLAAAEKTLEQALIIDPDDMVARSNLGYCLYFQGRYTEALASAQVAMESSPTRWLYYQKAICQVQLGDLDSAADNVAVAIEKYGRNAFACSVSSVIAAKRGQRSEAERLIQAVAEFERFGHYHHAQHDVACTYSILGMPEEALVWLRQAAESGFPSHTAFANDPHLAPLRHDPRFVQFLEDLEKECAVFEQLHWELSLAPKDG